MRHIKVFEEHSNVIDNKAMFKSLINWKFVNYIESIMTNYEDKNYTFSVSVGLRQYYTKYTGKEFREFCIWCYPNIYVSSYNKTCQLYGLNNSSVTSEFLNNLYHKDGFFYSFRFELPKDDPIRRYVGDIVIEKEWKIRDEIYKKITEKFKVEMVGRYSTGFDLKLF